MVYMHLLCYNFEYDPEYRITLDCYIYSLAKNFHSKYF